MPAINFCEGCPHARKFTEESYPHILEMRMPSSMRAFFQNVFKSASSTPVDVYDQNGERRTTMIVPNDAIERQGSIRSAVNNCTSPVGRHCGAVAMLHAQYAPEQQP